VLDAMKSVELLAVELLMLSVPFLVYASESLRR
jgi:hypothetical protein